MRPPGRIWTREAAMAEVQVPKAERGYVLRPWKWMASTLAAIQQWRQAGLTRKAIAGLDRDQLTDIGYLEPPRPTIEVKPGLITNLMSMS